MDCPAHHLLFNNSGELFLTFPTSALTSKASISSAGKGRSRSSGGLPGSESRSSQRNRHVSTIFAPGRPGTNKPRRLYAVPRNVRVARNKLRTAFEVLLALRLFQDQGHHED